MSIKSSSDTTGTFPPWRWTYDYTLTPSPDHQAQILTTPNGTTTRFTPSAATTTHPYPHWTSTPTGPATGVLVPSAPDHKSLTWWAPTGLRYQFTPEGALQAIEAPRGERTELIRDRQGVLLQVIDPQGRRLVLVYQQQRAANGHPDTPPLVRHIDTPIGRFSYDYTNTQPPRLAQVSLPTDHDAEQTAHRHANRIRSHANLRRLYHHEDPAHPGRLTGITLQGAGRDGMEVSESIALQSLAHAPLAAAASQPPQLPANVTFLWDAGPQRPSGLRLSDGTQLTLAWDPNTGWLQGMHRLAPSGLEQRLLFQQDARQQLYRITYHHDTAQAPQVMTLDYDAHGRPTGPDMLAPDATTTRLSVCPSPGAISNTAPTTPLLRRDTQGRITHEALPDGSWLVFQRSPHGQVIGLAHQRLHTPWLHWAVPAQTLIGSLTQARFQALPPATAGEPPPQSPTTHLHATLAGADVATLSQATPVPSPPGEHGWRDVWHDLLTIAGYWLGGQPLLPWRPARSTANPSRAAATPTPPPCVPPHELPWGVQALQALSAWAAATFTDPAGSTQSWQTPACPQTLAAQPWTRWGHWQAWVYALQRGSATDRVTADQIGEDALGPMSSSLSLAVCP